MRRTVLSALALVTMAACASHRFYVSADQLIANMEIRDALWHLKVNDGSLKEVFHTFDGHTDNYADRRETETGRRDWRNRQRFQSDYTKAFVRLASDPDAVRWIATWVLRPMYRDLVGTATSASNHPLTQRLDSVIRATRVMRDHWEEIRGRWIHDECSANRCLIFHGYRDIFALPYFEPFYGDKLEPRGEDTLVMTRGVTHGTGHLLSFLYRRASDVGSEILNVYIMALEGIRHPPTMMVE